MTLYSGCIIPEKQAESCSRPRYFPNILRGKSPQAITSLTFFQLINLCVFKKIRFPYILLDNL